MRLERDDLLQIYYLMRLTRAVSAVLCSISLSFLSVFDATHHKI